MSSFQNINLRSRNGVSEWNSWRETEPTAKPDLSGVKLRRAKLQRANFRETLLIDADLTGAKLKEADLTRADLSGAELTGANLMLADLVDTVASYANFSAVSLDEADLTRAKLRGATFAWATLTRSTVWYADLAGANFIEADLDWTNLLHADLSSANLTLVKSQYAMLSNANLRGANCSGAKLTGADFTDADLRGVQFGFADLSGADFSRADLTGADLSGAICVQTNFSNATLTGCNVYGLSAWDVTLDGAIQTSLRITPSWEKSTITVDNLEVAQFLYLMLHNSKVRDVLDTITSKVILIIGRFSDERKPVLDEIREALRNHPNGYIPVLFDFEPQRSKPILDTVKTLATLSRFVIADLTDPHMVRSELSYIIPNLPTVPVQPIIQSDTPLLAEYETWERYNSLLPLYRYRDLPNLIADLDSCVIAQIEGKVRERRL